MQSYTLPSPEASGAYAACSAYSLRGYTNNDMRMELIDDEIGWEKAALIEPLACAIHAVERGEIRLGDHQFG